MKNVMQFRTMLLLACAFTLAACGFHLRGLAEMSFKTLYIQESGSSAILKELRRSLTGSGVQLVPTPEAAEMHLELMDDKTEKRILSLSGSGKVREYELVYRVNLRMRDANSELWGAPQAIEIRRDYSYDDTQLLAKEGEEARLYSDMRSDASREIMRRLSALRTTRPGAN